MVEVGHMGPRWRKSADGSDVPWQPRDWLDWTHEQSQAWHRTLYDALQLCEVLRP